ncbi:MAG: FAD:protein FMN transferase [Ruminococcus sp.]|nr:FAD:protein FMN transferase [Ruminococcus sp.]
MNKKLRAILPIGTGLALIAAGAVMMIKAPVQHFDRTFFAMDCPCEITVYSKDDCTKAIYDRITELDGMLSAYDEGSEINRLNSAGRLEKVSKETADVISKSQKLYQTYGGCSIAIGAVTKLWDITGDPRVPSEDSIEKALESVDISNIKLDGESAELMDGAQIDLGCDAKGYALDEAKKELDKLKADAAVVSFGSSVLCYGKKPDGSRFTVGIKDPMTAEGICAEVELDECFLSTSGGYERFFEADGVTYCHIFDEKTGRPTDSDLLSVTVVGGSGILTDFLSTRIYLDGTAGLEKWLALDDISVIAIDGRGQVYCSDDIKDSVKITGDGFKLI